MHATYVVKQESARMEDSYMVLSIKPLVHLIENRVQGWPSAGERSFILSKHELKCKQGILLGFLPKFGAIQLGLTLLL